MKFKSPCSRLDTRQSKILTEFYKQNYRSNPCQSYNEGWWVGYSGMFWVGMCCPGPCFRKNLHSKWYPVLEIGQFKSLEYGYPVPDQDQESQNHELGGTYPYRYILGQYLPPTATELYQYSLKPAWSLQSTGVFWNRARESDNTFYIENILCPASLENSSTTESLGIRLNKDRILSGDLRDKF